MLAGTRRLWTIFLRAPYQDWAALAQGYKTEFRSRRRGGIELHVPTPVVLYAVGRQDHRMEKLMVLAEVRQEKLLDLAENPAALMREGFQSYDDFRRYWRARTGKRYDPLLEVCVYRLSPWMDSERLRLGIMLCDRLYGDYMP